MITDRAKKVALAPLAAEALEGQTATIFFPNGDPSTLGLRFKGGLVVHVEPMILTRLIPCMKGKDDVFLDYQVKG